MQPKFSIIMPSYLGDYPGAAKDRPAKFIRAVQSVVDQTFLSWELIIIADGCMETADLFAEHFWDRQSIECYWISKCEQWCPSVRNAGLTKVSGEWVVYLDTDDYWGPDHLSILSDRTQWMLSESRWAWFDALIPYAGQFVPMQANIKRCASHGTANIIHRPGPLWPTQIANRSTGKLDYGTQDCAFTDALKKLPGGEFLGLSEYHVCHMPNRFDV
jgi:hypothetical protein